MLMNEHDYLDKRREAQDMLLLLKHLKAQPTPPFNWNEPNFLKIPSLMFVENSWLNPEPYETTIDGRPIKVSRVEALIRPDVLVDMTAKIRHFIDAPMTTQTPPPPGLKREPTSGSGFDKQSGSYSHLPIVDVSRTQSPAQFEQQHVAEQSSAASSAGIAGPAGPGLGAIASGPGAGTDGGIGTNATFPSAFANAPGAPIAPIAPIAPTATTPNRAPSKTKWSSRGLRKGFFLQGCLGSGKSYAMLVFALYLRITYPDIRTVFISDCAQWDKCNSTFEYLELIFEGIACALIDHEHIISLIDNWREEYRSKTAHLGDHASTLVTKISNYCRDREIKIVFLYDNIDKMTLNMNFFEHPSYRTIMNIKRKLPFFAVFSALDQTITEDIKRRFTSTHHHISSSFTREEGLVYIGAKCPLLKLDERIINDFVKSTWFHPNELRRLCRALANATTEQQFDRINQQFRVQVNFALNPRPYSKHKTPADNDIKLTIFRVYFSFPCENPVIDGNYIDTSASIDGILRFSCPRIANLVFKEQLGDEAYAFGQIGLIIGDAEEARHQLAVAAMRWILENKGEFIEESVPRSRARIPVRYLDTSTERLRPTDTYDFINKMVASVSTIDTTSSIAYYCVKPVIGDIDFVLYNEKDLRSLKFIKCLMCNPLKLKIELRHIDTEIAQLIKSHFEIDNRPVEFYIICSRKAASFASRRLPRVNEIGCKVHIIDITSLNWIKNLEVYQFN
ncbi:hypothetical protein GGI12_001087 [Dipsacomyces acuminosporus]|nr:hypothetical protein GGI12_001087 [Dipsacomyces acuminosporus]